jgi:hypothetical protein
MADRSFWKRLFRTGTATSALVERSKTLTSVLKPIVGPDHGIRQPVLCDCCNRELNRAREGYHLTTLEVAWSERYWEFRFQVQHLLVISQEHGRRMFAESVRSTAHDCTTWMICETCSEFFIFDRDEARALAVKGMSAESGKPLSTEGVELFAALGWQRKYGSWPANVERPETLGWCSFCEKQMYVGEYEALVSPAGLAQNRATGLLHEPRMGPKRLEGKETWVMCMPCLALLDAKGHGKSHSAM